MASACVKLVSRSRLQFARHWRQAHSFEVEVDSTQFSPYISGGIATQVKQSKTLDFQSLADAIANPGEFLLTDFSKFERSPLLHVGFQALDQFQVCPMDTTPQWHFKLPLRHLGFRVHRQHTTASTYAQAEKGRLPAPASEADAQLLIQMATAINAAAKQEAAMDENILRLLAFGASADLNPMAAMFGGVVGQEVVKAASGKFHPLFQWLYFDAVEALPPIEKLTAEECAPQVMVVPALPALHMVSSSHMTAARIVFGLTVAFL